MKKKKRHIQSISMIQILPAHTPAIPACAHAAQAIIAHGQNVPQGSLWLLCRLSSFTP